MPPEQVRVSRRVPAAAHVVFGVITDPRMHVEIDGSGMLEAAPDAHPLTAVGDTFVIDMDREPLGDIPLGKYTVRNTVTQIVPDTLLEWNVGGLKQPAFGHVYGYELTEVAEAETDVTLYCDWSGVADPGIRERFPIVPVAMLEKSLDNLEHLLSSADPR